MVTEWSNNQDISLTWISQVDEKHHGIRVSRIFLLIYSNEVGYKLGYISEFVIEKNRIPLNGTQQIRQDPWIPLRSKLGKEHDSEWRICFQVLDLPPVNLDWLDITLKKKHLESGFPIDLLRFKLKVNIVHINYLYRQYSFYFYTKSLTPHNSRDFRAQ